MVEKARTMARKLEIPQWKSSGTASSSDGLPSPTSPLDRASPRGWRHRDAVGGVGLGILAALEAQPSASSAAAAAAAAAVPKVTGPVSIARRARLEVSELGCSGRCATSLCGGGAQAHSALSSDGLGRPGSPGSAAFRVAEFLSCCGMCRRALDGKDIFMYRGERAFCSMECRYHAIVSDEFQEEKERKRRAAAAAVSSAAAADGSLPRKAADMAGSPCSGGGGQIFFTTGIVAA